jgi:hypothetical protein
MGLIRLARVNEKIDRVFSQRQVARQAQLGSF